MRRTLAILSLLVAWFCANGAVLDAVQVFAWTRMFAGYAESMPVSRAIEETFDASKPCPICSAIKQARAREQSPAPAATSRDAAKIVLVCEMPAARLVPPTVTVASCPFSRAMPRRTDPVPVPPPRV